MNIKILFLFLVCTLIGNLPVARADETLVVRAHVPQLTIVAKEGETGSGNIASYDLGEWPLWDNSRASDTWAGLDPGELWQGSPVTKVFHRFTLQNKTNEPVIVTGFKKEGNIEAVRSSDLGKFPFKVSPGHKINLDIYFAYDISTPGKLTGSVIVLGAETQKPLATMNLSSRVTTGIKIEPQMLNWGEIPGGEETSSEFIITFDRHIPSIMMPIPLKLYCKNPALKIEWKPTIQPLMGVKVQGDTIKFPPDSKDLPEDLKLTFNVKLTKVAPLGKLDEHIRLIGVGAPYMSVVQGTQIRVQGNITTTNPPALP